MGVGHPYLPLHVANGMRKSGNPNVQKKQNITICVCLKKITQVSHQKHTLCHCHVVGKPNSQLLASLSIEYGKLQIVPSIHHHRVMKRTPVLIENPIKKNLAIVVTNSHVFPTPLAHLLWPVGHGEAPHGHDQRSRDHLW